MTEKHSLPPPNGGVPTDPGRHVDAIGEVYLDRLLAGEKPDREAILAAHPEISDPLGRRLALVEMIYRARLPRDRRDP